MRTEIITRNVTKDPEQYAFGEIPCGTAFTVADRNDIYIKTMLFTYQVIEGIVEVNAVNVKTGVGTWFADTRVVKHYTQVVYWR